MSTGKKEQVRSMFNHIAFRYDFLNHLLSLGIDKGWRKKTVRALKPISPKLILDVATGTGDLALALIKLNPEKITGIDISEGMLAVGQEKMLKKGLNDRVELMVADCEQLPFQDASFHAATIGFGIRNFEHPQLGLNELHRVLKPGGMLAILEFSYPKNPLVKVVYLTYFKFVLPLIGRIFSRHKQAYSYLPASVEAFPYGEAFLEMLRKAGFEKEKATPLSFGIANLYTCFKP